MKIEIIKEKCTACGLCARECPVGALEVIDDVAVVDLNKCIYCGACANVCPTTAIIVERPSLKPKTPFGDCSGIWVFCEQRRGKTQEVAFELLSEGRRLADRRRTKLCAVLIGYGVEKLADELISYGADKVYIVDDERLSSFKDDAYASAITALAKKYKPEAIIAGATVIGRTLLPRVAAILQTGLTADCTELDIDTDGSLVQTRPAFGGNIMATILCKRHRPQMATVRPKVMKKSQPSKTRWGEKIVERLNSSELSSKIEIVETKLEEGLGLGLAESDIIVSGGGGLRNREGFEMIRELASLVGAAVGASRTAVDRGWASYPHQVGQTGRTVCPKLYIAVGISGAIQHLVGMQTAEKIIAINQDAGAPIFRVADVGIVGDLFEVMPKLIEELRELSPAERIAGLKR